MKDNDFPRRHFLRSMMVVGAAMSALGAPAPGRAETVWLPASSVESLVGPVVLGAHSGLAEEGVLGDFLVSTVCVEPNAGGGYARYTAMLPAAGKYYVWARIRCFHPAAEPFAIAPEGEDGSDAPPRPFSDAGTAYDDWHWIDLAVRSCGTGPAQRLTFELPAGHCRFRLYAREAHDSVFAPGNWTMARPMFNPRLNVVCLSTDGRYVPTDADAQQALGLAPSHFSDASLRAPLCPIPPLSDEKAAIPGKQAIPDWLRCPCRPCNREAANPCRPKHCPNSLPLGEQRGDLRDCRPHGNRRA